MAVGVGDVFLATALGTWGAQRIMLTHTYAVTEAGNNVDDLVAQEALISEISGAVGQGDLLETDYRTVMPNNYTLLQWRAQKIFPQRYRSSVQARNVVALSSPASTGNLAAVLTLRTDLAGRAQISNKHIGPLPDDQVNVFQAGALLPAYKAALETLADSLTSNVINAATGVAWVPCIFHRGPVPGSNRLTDFIVQDTVRVMRRRTLGVGI